MYKRKMRRLRKLALGRVDGSAGRGLGAVVVPVVELLLRSDLLAKDVLLDEVGDLAKLW